MAQTTTLERPAPQADRLSVVATVVDAIAAGCITAEAISDAIGMSGRQGAYYPNAAWTLGYAEPVAHTSPTEWQLTDRGAAFADLTAADRAADLTAVLADLDELVTFTDGDDGADALASEWSTAGYSEETVSRRVQTISAWAEFLTADPAAQAATLAAAQSVTADRAPAAREADAVRRAARTSATRAKVVNLGSVCTSCYITKPLTGICPTC